MASDQELGTVKLTDAERDFYELCYKQYTREMDTCESIFHRSGTVLTAVPVIGAVLYSLGRSEVIPKAFVRVDTFLYCVFALIAWLALAACITFLIRAIILRAYPALAPMKKWHDWTEEYRKRFPNGGNGLSADGRDIIGAELIRSLIPLLADAQTKCAETNEKRRRLLQRAIIAAAVAIACIGPVALLHVLLHLQGV